MGELAMLEAVRTYRFSRPKVEIHQFEKVACPICEKLCGGKSGFWGEQGRLEGVHMHMKFVHGIKQKWRREELLAKAAAPTTDKTEKE